MGLNKRNKKICFVNDFATGGGVENFIQVLANNFCEKYQIFVVSDVKDPNFYSFYKKNIKYYYRYCDYSFKVKLISRFLNKINRIRSKWIMNVCDTVVFSKVSVTYKYAIDCKASKKIGWCHGDLETNIYELNAFKELNISSENLKIFDKVVCVSKKVKESLINYCGDSGNIIVRYNPINVKEILKKSAEVADVPKKKKTRFVAIGRISYEKGFDLLIEAANQLVENTNKFELLIIGNGPELKNVKDIVSKKLDKCIKFLGHKDNPFPYLKTADWYISTSRTEGFSLSSQEAAVLGIPLLLTDVSGARDLIGDNNEFGILTEINASSVYNAMKNVIENKDLCKYYKEKMLQKSKTFNYLDSLSNIEELL